MAEGLGIRNRSRDVGFRQQNGLGQAAAVGQMAGEGGREGASCAVSRSRALALGLKDFLLDPSGGGEAEQVDSFLEIAAGNNDICGSENLQSPGSLSHGIQRCAYGNSTSCSRGLGGGGAGQRDTGDRSGFIEIRSNHFGEREEPLNHEASSRRIQQIGP